MKTKGVFWRYPRKISLLKDLREGYPRASLLRKPMKTGGELGITSKISLLKDLAGDTSSEYWPLVNPFPRKPRVVKDLKSHCCYQTANANLTYISRLGSIESREKWPLGRPKVMGSLSTLRFFPNLGKLQVVVLGERFAIEPFVISCGTDRSTDFWGCVCTVDCA
jgi:hypothetical protein